MRRHKSMGDMLHSEKLRMSHSPPSPPVALSLSRSCLFGCSFQVSDTIIPLFLTQNMCWIILILLIIGTIVLLSTT